MSVIMSGTLECTALYIFMYRAIQASIGYPMSWPFKGKKKERKKKLCNFQKSW